MSQLTFCRYSISQNQVDTSCKNLSGLIRPCSFVQLNLEVPDMVPPSHLKFQIYLVSLQTIHNLVLTELTLEIWRWSNATEFNFDEEETLQKKILFWLVAHPSVPKRFKQIIRYYYYKTVAMSLVRPAADCRTRVFDWLALSAVPCRLSPKLCLLKTKQCRHTLSWDTSGGEPFVVPRMLLLIICFY